MPGEHHYRLRTVWTGDRGAGTTGHRDYDRSVTVSAPGKPDIAASADVPFRGDGTRWNPEDMLLAALSECHLLSYLHACVAADVVVVGYEDDASAVMAQDGGNGGAFTHAVLRPHVTVTEERMVEAALRAHQPAHEWCFIANSVNFPVHVDPTVTVADGEISDVRGAGPA